MGRRLGKTLQVAMVAAWLALTPAPAQAAAPKSGDGVIAYTQMADLSGTAGVVVVRPDGTNLQTFTIPSKALYYPAVSPDGMQVAFATETGTGGYPDQLWVGDVETGAMTSIYSATNGVNTQTWTPDGKRIVFAGTGTSLKKIAPTGGSTTSIPISGSDVVTQPRYSPDGTKITFAGAATGDGCTSVWVVPSSGGAATQLTDPCSLGPDFSADGTKIAYHDVTNDTVETAGVGGGGGGTIASVDSWGNGAVAYSPSGKFIVFADNAAGGSVKVVSASGGTGTILAAGWAPDWGGFACDNSFTDGDDHIIGTSGKDVLCGGKGSDVLEGKGGNDVLLGGAATDTLVDEGGNDRLYGEGGQDFIFAGAGDDEVWGGDGDEHVMGEEGDDTLHGGPGKDFLEGEEGNDLILGEGGDDDVPQGSSTGGLVGGPGNDDLRGGPGKDELAGDDLLDGSVSGDDSLDGGPGVDLVWGGPGSDIISGGDDKDFLWGGGGADTIMGDEGHDEVHGEDGKDDLDGGGGDDLLEGGGQGDEMRGEAGSDKLRAGSGGDLLVGGTRKDVLRGEEGDDTILAKDGVLDEVDGGTGNDEAKVDNVDLVSSVERLL